MNELLSQFNSVKGKNNSTNLLKQQQLTKEQINKLIDKMTESIMCGPECQKQKKISELEQKYMAAKTNVLTAPSNLEQIKQQYYVYKNGQPYYDEMMEKELKEKSEEMGGLISKKFEDQVNNAQIMNKYYNSDLINSTNTKDLYQEYLQKTELLEKKLKDSHGDILTNDRKTYYESEALTGLYNWYSFLWYAYYLMVIVFILMAFLVPNDFSIAKKIIISAFIVFFPYMTFPLFQYIKGWVIRTYYILFPKNIYKTI